MRKHFFMLSVIALTCQLHAIIVGPQCPNHEVFTHINPGLPAINQALNHYTYGSLSDMHGMLPILNALAPSIGISLAISGTYAPIAWHQVLHPLAGGPLTLNETCRIAAHRQLRLGFNVRFRHPHLIQMIAAGGAIPPGLNAYVNRALYGGGYFNPMAVALYKLIRVMPVPVFTVIPGMANRPDCVAIQFKTDVRISKNMKELSYNSLLQPAIPGALPYMSIKAIINNQYAFLGLPNPSSITVVSSDNLQAR